MIFVLFSVLLIAHLYGDFFQQLDWQATHKSKWRTERLGRHALLAHVGTYTLILGLFLLPACAWYGIPLWKYLAFVAFNALAHLLTDAFTSQMTTKYWFLPVSPDNQWMHNANWISYKTDVLIRPNYHNRHWFFVWIGIDQTIHFLTLLWTLKVLLNA